MPTLEIDVAPSWQVPEFEPVLTSRERRHPIVLPEDPDGEELARHWTLGSDDRDQALQCRGDDSRRWFALQLCTLRSFGRFLKDDDAVPPRLVTYISQQLDLENVIFPVPPHPNTQVEQERRIREHLGFSLFDDAIKERLSESLMERARREMYGIQLYRAAEAQLLQWRVVLPGPSTLERMVSTTTAKAREESFDRVAQCLTPQLREALDGLLATEGQIRSALYLGREYPKKPRVGELVCRLEHYNRLQTLNLEATDWTSIPADHIQQLAALARRYDAASLRRLETNKRHALVACLALESQRNLLDHLVGLHDGYLKKAKNSAKSAMRDKARKELRQRKKGLITMAELGDIVLVRASGDLLTRIQERLSDAEVQAGVMVCRSLVDLDDNGWIEHIGRKYSAMRKYLPAFFNLPFVARPSAGDLMEAVQLVRQLDEDEKRTMPRDVPLDFVPSGWLPLVLQKDGRPQRALWEIALAHAVRDALRNGDLFLPQSGRHVSLSNLIYEDGRWANEREDTYRELSLPVQADGAWKRLLAGFDQVACKTERGLSSNPAVKIENGKLHLKRRDALEIPASVRALRRLIEAHLPDVRIEQLVAEVDHLCHMTDALVPLPGTALRSVPSYGALLASLVAQGTNLGVLAMGKSATGLSTDMLQNVMEYYIREETLVRANAMLVEYHHGLPISRVWGDGSRSSSDAQRFAVRRSSLLATSYPLYFGYYDRAIGIYTHTSDQMSVFSTQVISCGLKEAPYVLDGWQRNNTVLTPSMHFTDTGGYTDHIFALCYLLGLSFMPRLADLPDQLLYKPIPDRTYGALEPLMRYNPDVELIPEEWDELVRVAASIRKKTAPAHVIVKQLQNSSDRRSKALTALGQLLKTIHILRYVHDPELRNWTQLQLNRGEHRHALVRRVFYADLGEFQRGDVHEIMNKATCLSLLSNAILVWNTVQIGAIVEKLRAAGTDVRDEDVARISPLLHKHIIVTGTYSFQMTK